MGAVIDLKNKSLSVTTGQGKIHSYPLTDRLPVRTVRPVFLSHRDQISIPPHTVVQSSATTNVDMPGKMWFEPDEDYQFIHGLTLSPVLCKIKDHKIPIQIYNSNDHIIMLKKHERIGELFTYSDAPNKNAQVISAMFTPGSNKKIKDRYPVKQKKKILTDEEKEKLIIRLYTEIDFGKGDLELSNEDKWEAIKVFLKHHTALALKDTDIGTVRGIEAKIETGTADPIKSKCRPLNPEVKDDLREQIDRWIKMDVVQPGNGAWSSPLHPVLKPNGKIRWTVDYSRLNKICKADCRPVANQQECLSKLKHIPPYRWFAAIDCSEAFYSCRLSKESRERSAFVSPFGLFEWKKMPMGLSNSPMVWNQVVELIKDRLLSIDKSMDSIMSYFDDTLIPAISFKELLYRLDVFLSVIEEIDLKIAIKKCKIHKEEIPFLGFKVNGEGLTVNEDRIKTLLNWKPPENVREVRSLHGTFSFYRRFIRNFPTGQNTLEKT